MQDVDGSQDVHGYRTNRRATVTESEELGHKHSDVIEPVPFYLVPQAIATEMRRLGGGVSEIHARRTGGHKYAITIVMEEEEE